MKLIKDLRKGDTIIVSYQETSCIFAETVTSIENNVTSAKTGIEGLVIHTKHEIGKAGREILRQKWPNHCPIFIPLASSSTNSHTFSAGSDVIGRILVVDEADVRVNVIRKNSKT